jgi:hypothetical protein
MSGYLSRIAASVIRPQPRVHPFVESIYPAVRREEAAGFVLQTEASVPVSRSAGTLAPLEHSAAAANAERVQGTERTEPGDKHEADLSTKILESPEMGKWSKEEASARTISSEREVLRPLLPPQRVGQQEAGMARMAVEPESKATSGLPMRSATPASTADHSLRVEAYARSYEPLVEPAVAQRARSTSASSESGPTAANLKRDVHATPSQPASRAVARALIGANAQARRAAPPPSEDIQIHIGRIEVIAVPPPAPRPAPAPVRKGLTLDEYLSGGNGRAR